MTIRSFIALALLFAGVFLFAPPETLAKDQWLQVQSKNFTLIGNASEKDMRKVATKLEQFRETFRLIFRKLIVDASVPTNVVVFKSSSSYHPFKPKTGDGKIDRDVAGYFQPGEDVNYITLTTEGTDEQIFGTVFHEYVHFVIETNFGKSDVPSWFNEGLAEYYQTFAIEEDQKVKLGLAQAGHLELLADNDLIPLSSFLTTSARSTSGGHSRSIFYAQSWALIHYLIFTGKGDGLDKFINLVIANRPPAQAFTEAFGIDYATMEEELRKYVGQRLFKYQVLTLKEKLVFDTQIKTTPITEAESNAYLGDLLYHIQRQDDAEPFLLTALKIEPDSSMANTSLGMVRIKQRRYPEAKAFLEKAIARNPRNHVAYYRYAQLISRESQDEFGFVDRFESATATRMLELLRKAIEINPAFAESYEMLAFISVVNNDNLEEAAGYLRTALKYQPGNSRYAVRLAEVYLRQDKFKEGLTIADKLAKSADDDNVRHRAGELASQLRQREKMVADYVNAGRPVEEPGRVTIERLPGEVKPTEEQLSLAAAAAKNRAINQSLRRIGTGELRTLGQITRVDCKPNGITYAVKTDTGNLQLVSKDFQELTLLTFVEDNLPELGCNANVAALNALVSYRPLQSRPGVAGELVAIEFVPKSFRLINLDTEPPPTTYIVEDVRAPGGSGPKTTEDFEAKRRAMMMKSIADALRRPAAGERRLQGFIERTECTAKGIFFYMRSGDQVYKLANANPQSIGIRGFTPDIRDISIQCGMKSVDLPVVFIFREAPDAKSKVVGELLSLEFVPKAFELGN